MNMISLARRTSCRGEMMHDWRGTHLTVDLTVHDRSHFCASQWRSDQFRNCVSAYISFLSAVPGDARKRNAGPRARQAFTFIRMNTGAEKHARTHKQHVRPHKGRWQLDEIEPINHLSDRFKFYLPAIHAVECVPVTTHVRTRLPRMDLFVQSSSRLTDKCSLKTSGSILSSSKIKSKDQICSFYLRDDDYQPKKIKKSHHPPCKCIRNQVTLIQICLNWQWRAAKI